MSEIMQIMLFIYFSGFIVMLICALIKESVDYVLLAPLWPLLYFKYVYLKIWGDS